jgi:hypothetical protein
MKKPRARLGRVGAEWNYEGLLELEQDAQTDADALRYQGPDRDEQREVEQRRP